MVFLPFLATGAVLTGSMTLGQLRRGTGASPAKYQVTYLVPPAAKAASKDGTKEGGASNDADKDKSPETKVGWVSCWQPVPCLCIWFWHPSLHGLFWRLATVNASQACQQAALTAVLA
jgi:hypothetical protein